MKHKLSNKIIIIKMISEYSNSFPIIPLLTREEWDDESRKRNRDAKIRHHIIYIPYAIRDFGNAIRFKNTEFKWCKLLLIRNRCIDVFSIIRPYIFDPDEWYSHSKSKLIDKRCIRVVEKLIQMESITDIPNALKIARYYDTQIRDYLFPLLKNEFIEKLTPHCVHLDLNIFNYWM